jgi:hypothetical protein
MKRLPRALPQPTTHIIDRFHIAMKIQPLQQVAADHAVRWHGAASGEMANIDADVRSLKWKLWRGGRVGLSPTGKRRLVTAHTSSGHFWMAPGKGPSG